MVKMSPLAFPALKDRAMFPGRKGSATTCAYEARPVGPCHNPRPDSNPSENRVWLETVQLVRILTTVPNARNTRHCFIRFCSLLPRGIQKSKCFPLRGVKLLIRPD